MQYVFIVLTLHNDIILKCVSASMKFPVNMARLEKFVGFVNRF